MSSKTRNGIYLAFLSVHFFASILIGDLTLPLQAEYTHDPTDPQALFFSASISPDWLRNIFLAVSADDPLLSKAGTYELIWFQSFLCFEFLVQLPMNGLSLIGVWTGSSSYYPILAVYSMSCIPTTIACIATLVATPGIGADLPKLLSLYVPFLLIPIFMCYDYVTRSISIIKQVEKQKMR